jgi:protein-S-isoprenylcysteine O-methyltransferase Ste14
LLGKNWANQIKIYSKHTLITKGVYKIVRHPLYASLIWIFYACSVLYLNWLAFLLNTLIFVPMMNYRAKQEEELLEKQFKDYKRYKNKVGRFFPKLKWLKK